MDYATGWRTRVRFLAEAGNFSFLPRVQTSSGTSYSMVTGGSFPGGKVDHSPPSRAIKGKVLTKHHAMEAYWGVNV
jgi:hypothetical protein